MKSGLAEFISQPERIMDEVARMAARGEQRLRQLPEPSRGLVSVAEETSPPKAIR